MSGSAAQARDLGNGAIVQHMGKTVRQRQKLVKSQRPTGKFREIGTFHELFCLARGQRFSKLLCNNFEWRGRHDEDRN